MQSIICQFAVNNMILNNSKNIKMVAVNRKSYRNNDVNWNIATLLKGCVEMVSNQAFLELWDSVKG